MTLLLSLLSALFGAVVAGAVQFFLARKELRRRSDAVRTAIVVEVKQVCELVRFRGYLTGVVELLEELEANEEMSGMVMADMQEEYFSVFHALSCDLGLLEPGEVSKIVEFYMIAKSAKDSIRPEDPLEVGDHREESVNNAKELKELLTRLLSIGDEISQWIPNS